MDNPFYRDVLFFGVVVLFASTFFFSTSLRKMEQWYYLVFLIGGSISGTFFMDPEVVESTVVEVLYPWALPMFYTIGPGLYLSYFPKAQETYTERLLHFSPALIIFLSQLFVYLFNGDTFLIQRQLVMELDITASSSTGLFSDAFIILCYPLHILFYALRLIVLARRDTRLDKYKNMLIPWSTILFLVPLYLVILDFMYEIVYINSAVVRLVLSLEIVVIMYDLYLGRRLFSKSAVLHQEIDPATTVLHDDIPKELGIDLSSNLARFTSFLYMQIEDGDSLFYKEQMKKEDILSLSPYSSEEWEEFFIQSNKTFVYYKKYIRVHRAIKLMSEGYLDHFSIGALTSEVGYNSRSSFYNAFLDVTGESLADFRKREKSR